MSPDLDGSNPPDFFLRQLQAADSQIFSGYCGYQSLFSPTTIKEIDRVAHLMSLVLLSGGKVAMTGCGTSGRLAFLTARRYNIPGLCYCIAGGDSALVLSDELPEDDPQLGVRNVEERVQDATMWMTIGISCGLSAPYVAGQIARSVFDAGDSGWGSGCALIGFNPAPMARDRLIEKCLPNGSSFTFRKVIEAALNSQKFSLLNPIIGPEPVAGSSRMKGGSATLILLDCLCARATSPDLTTISLLLDYQLVHAATYAAAMNQPELQQIMLCAAESMARGGKLFYVGAESEGCVGFIDLSEMPDTYGAPFDQTRAFVVDGWRSVKNNEGDISHRSPLLRLGLDHFITDVAPSLQHNDTVIFLSTEKRTVTSATAELLDLCKRQNSRTARIHVYSNLPMNPQDNLLFQVKLPSCQREGFTDLSIKLVLNAVSTFAQAKGRGALYRGLMIAAGPSNDKIYQRCVEMISAQIGVTIHAAEVAIVRSIYGLERDDAQQIKKMMSLPRVAHIKAALLPEDQRHLPVITLPVAFLLAIPPQGHFRGWLVEEARKAISNGEHLGVLLKKNSLTLRSKAQSKQPLLVGVDLGGTSVRSVIITAEGVPIGSIQRALLLGDRSPASVSSQVCDIIKRAVAQLPSERIFDVVSIGIGQPGFALPDGSITGVAAFTEVWGAGTVVPLAENVTQFLHDEYKITLKPVVFDDAACALAGEVFFGSGRLANTVVMLTVGTGLGSAVSLRRGTNFHRGARGLIEIGHMIALPTASATKESPLCPCGQRGCTELFVSGSAIVRSMEGKFSTAEEVFAASVTDVQCAAAIDDASSALSIAIVNVIRAYDPDVVVVGGGLAPKLLSSARTHLRSVVWKLHNDAADVPVSLASCQEPGALGAAILGWRRCQTFLEEPGFVLRHATLDDIPGLYNVCLKTGDSGNDGTHLYSDPKLLGSIFVGEYVTLSSAFAFALVDDQHSDHFNGVSGYVLGVLDTASFTTECERHWWPRLQNEYPLEKLSAYRDLEQGFIRDYIHKIPNENSGPLRLSPSQLAEYPSHMHIDLLQHAQGRGFGPIMVNRLLDALRGAGSTGIHLCMSAVNHRAYGFYKKLGFHIEVKGESEWIMARKL